MLQDDLLYESLTVFETLYYAAMLRLPQHMDHAAKMLRVQTVITALGLSSCKDTIIGKATSAYMALQCLKCISALPTHCTTAWQEGTDTTCGHSSPTFAFCLMLWGVFSQSSCVTGFLFEDKPQLRTSQITKTRITCIKKNLSWCKSHHCKILHC